MTTIYGDGFIADRMTLPCDKKEAGEVGCTPGVFDEQALYVEVCKVWGEHGAHAEVLRDLLKHRDQMVSALRRISDEAGNDYGGNFTWRVSEEAMWYVRAALSKSGSPT
jgi:hypothetical protein